jgi:PIN domain nuclease of toxin-antitoxin system
LRLLLDTHIVLALIDGRVSATYPAFARALSEEELTVSVVSLWEIAIKVRLGKLATRVLLPDLAGALDHQGVSVMELKVRHAVADVEPSPMTRDPFDRLLLAIAQVEGLKLVTADRVLADHPAAFRP